MKTWQVIEALRKEKKISKSRLAELMGVEPYMITNWTTRNSPPLEAIVRLARIFDVPVDQIATAATVLGESPITPVRSQPDSKTTPQSADISSSTAEEQSTQMPVPSDLYRELIELIRNAPDPGAAIQEIMAAASSVVTKQRVEQHRQNKPGHKTACL